MPCASCGGVKTSFITVKHNIVNGKFVKTKGFSKRFKASNNK